ncbi:pentatricopeptide repeat-containing protein At4g31070, mitochondrial-like [Aristolochia californica]|uniref:pentatricopeptide repeat-containing protein At4g31070, mitochondrial-like n=1 Tax=Aristolochia californica TaxID=171875 RepID=UPI0035DB86DD
MELLGNAHVATALIDMYLKFDELDPAMEIFDKMPERDVVSCTSMITGCVRLGKYDQAFRIFRMMQLGDHKPNWVTVLGLLPACDYSIHGFIIKSGFDFSVEVQTAILDMYAKYGNIVLAQEVFDQMQEKSLVSWSAMVTAYSRNKYAHEALGIFYQMQRFTDFRLDHIIAASVLQACTQLGSLNYGEMVHGYILKSGFASDLLTETALLDMYAKCGSISAAETVFNGMQKSSMISWSAMIAGYGFHGLGHKALKLFHNMKGVGFVPDESSFLSVLSACSHSGLVREGCGRWEDVLKVRAIIRRKGDGKMPGWSLIEVNSKLHGFLAEDRSHSEASNIYLMLLKVHTVARNRDV